MCDEFGFCGVEYEKDRGVDGRYIWLVGGSDAQFLCMLTSRWMCGENSKGESLAGRQINGVECVCRVTYCRMVE